MKWSYKLAYQKETFKILNANKKRYYTVVFSYSM